MTLCFSAASRFTGCFWTALFLAAGLFPGVERAAAQSPGLEPGIRSVAAFPDRIEFETTGAAPGLQLLDLLPNQDEHDAAAAVALPIEGGTHFDVPRFDGQRDRIYDGFILRRAGGQAAGPVRHVEKWEGIAKNTEAIPVAASRKGLQVQMVEDAIALGIKHGAINLDLAALIDPAAQPDSLAWTMDGRVFHFRRAVTESHDKNIKALSDAGIQVTLILLNYKTPDPAITAIMKPPQSRPNPVSPILGFNVRDLEGSAWYRAALEFLADRYSGADSGHGRVMGYIIGNEVDSHYAWYDIGDVTIDGLVDNYERAVRLAHTAIRKASAHARVYLSLDRQWAKAVFPEATRACSSRALLDAFARQARQGGDFDWNLAFHPYPAEMHDPRTWLDHVGTDFDTELITPRNLELLPAYLRRPGMLYQGEPRRIILSEQGFNTPPGEEGERLQAAGFCYTWVKLSRLQGIDAFILHRHVDHAQEGLMLGLWTHKPGTIVSPDRHKAIYEVFRACDTPQWEAAFAPFLPVTGLHGWDEVK